MSDKITMEELQDLFGETIPQEAFMLLHSHPSTWSTDDLRAALKEYVLKTEMTVRPFKITDEIVRYISRYGGMCRDCADNFGLCPTRHMPCEDDQAIRFVLEALNYGVKHHYIELEPA